MNKTLPAGIAVAAALGFALSGCQPAELGPTLSTPASPTEPPTPAPATVEPADAIATQMQLLPTPELIPTEGPIPSLQTPIQVGMTADLPYTSQELLDVYAPATAGDWPVVVVLHGAGAYKGMIINLAEAIAGQGAVVFVPTYRASAPRPSDRIGGGAEDAACAIRFARAHAGDYGANDNRLVVVGHSAGGLMAALMMFAGDEFHGDCLTEEGSALPDALVGLDGSYDPIPLIPEEVLRAAPAECLRISPFTYIDRTPIREGVRFLLFVGSYASAQPHAQAFRDALRAAGYDVSLTQIPGVDHGDMASALPQTVGAVVELMHP